MSAQPWLQPEAAPAPAPEAEGASPEPAPEAAAPIGGIKSDTGAGARNIESNFI